MHGFESIICEILETEGYWVKPSFKVELTKGEKRRIGRPSAPRWELDIVAYRGSDNSVLVVECKSYLDSPGVGLGDIKGGRYRSRYKLFTEATLRRIVFRRLGKQLVDANLCPVSPSIQLALAAGRIKGDGEALKTYFHKKSWLLFDPAWIKERLKRASGGGYVNSVAAMVAKLLLR